MKKSKLAVSVIMPVYNSEKYLREAIESILNQTYKNFEFVIINDGSTDGSSEIIEYYRERDVRIDVINYTKPHGYGGEVASSLAIKKCKGKYIAKMDSDDISLHDRLEKQVNFLDKNPDIFLVGGQAFVIDGGGNVVGTRRNPCSYSGIFESFYLKNCFIHPTVMFRNSSFEDNFYRTDFKYFNDYSTWYRCLLSGKKMVNLPDYLLKYRVHDNNTTYTNVKPKYEENYKIKQHYLRVGNFNVRWTYRIIIYIQLMAVRLLSERLIVYLYRKCLSIEQKFNEYHENKK